MSKPWYKLVALNRYYQGKDGTIRKVLHLTGGTGARCPSRVEFDVIQGPPHRTGNVTWATWRRWAEGEWFPPRPERLPVPEVSDLELAFPTARHAPSMRWVYDWDNSSDATDHEKSVWHGLFDAIWSNYVKAEDCSFVPREGINAEKAWRAIQETIGAYNRRHEEKSLICAYMLSQWFQDTWARGDEVTRIFRDPVAGLGPAA